MKLLLLSVFVAYAAAQCVINDTSPTPLGQARSFTCFGKSIAVAIPPNCLVPNTCGLIFDVHGAFMNDVSQNQGTGLKIKGPSAGFVVAQPNAGGILSTWSAADDVNILSAVVAIRDAFNIDPRRVHFGGFSQGGWMTWRMICRAETLGLIASFAPMSAGLGGTAPSCFGATAANPQHTILHFHGRQDSVVSFNEATRATADIRTAQASDPSRVDVELFRDGFFDRQRLTGNGIFFESVYGSFAHCMPGGSGGCCACGGTYDTGTEIVNFFLTHPMAKGIEPVPRMLPY